MTNEELITDLKQFIKTTVSQEVAVLRTELKADINNLRTELKADMNSLRTELKADIKDVRSDIALLDEKLDTIQDAIAESVQDQDRRLRRLERRAA